MNCFTKGPNLKKTNLWGGGGDGKGGRGGGPSVSE